MFFVLGSVGAIVGSFIAMMGFLMVMMTDGGVWENRAGIILGLFLGVLPFGLSALMIASGIRARGRFRRLGELAAVARHKRELVTEDVAVALAISPTEAEKLILDASTLGLIDADGTEPTVLAPSTPAPPAEAPRALVAPGGPAPSPELIAPGLVLAATYRIEERIGSGGMGEVHAARHLRTGRRYAVKTIHRSAQTDELVRRFEREATAASALGHPGIVAVHDFNVTPGGVFYLVMDLLEGETLDARLARQGSLDWPDAKRVILEVGSALAAAHAHGLLHRDVKPSNVFLTRAGAAPERAVLLDFGLVKPLDEAASRLTGTGAVLGTPMYMSPEQALGEPLDVRSDLYSLAAVAFEAITGAPPFLDRTLAAVYARVLAQAAPRATDVATRPVPREVDEVLARALAKAKDQRYPDIRSFADALWRIQDDPTSFVRKVV